MDLMTYRETLPADRIEIYGLPNADGVLDFLTMYHLGEVQYFGTYLGQDYGEAVIEAGRLEQVLALPVFDFVGLLHHDFAAALLHQTPKGVQ